MRIPVLTLWQPWASLLAIGAKEFETRGFSIAYRGPIGIHAAKRWSGEQAHYCELSLFRRALVEGGLNPNSLPRGCMLGIADLTNIWPTENLRPRLEANGQRQELEFGNYQPGRFGWWYQNVRRLAEPLPVTGQQGVWYWAVPESLVEELGLVNAR
jgi:activating signal cointegrator 1